MSLPVAVVAGGGKNLGGLISSTLAIKQGYAVVVHYNSVSSKAASDATVSSITQAGGKAWAVQADLTDVKNVTSLFEFAKSKGTIYAAVNTVGKVLKKPLMNISENEYDSMMNINSKVAFFFIQEALKHLEDGASIVSIVTSLLAAYTPYYSIYQGSKAPVEYFTKSASKEAMARGIRVNAVAPGPMDTPFFYPQEEDDAVAYHKSAAVEGRLTKIEDIVPAIALLVDREQKTFFNGQTLFINGGYTAK